MKKTMTLVVLCLFGISAVAGQAENDQKSLVVDVAWDCRTFNYMRAVPLDQTVRGDRAMFNGKIFPANTLRDGTHSNDPNAPGSIGTWVGRLATTATLAEHIAAPASPAIYWTQYLSLSKGMIVTEGWHAPAGANDNAVVGGTREYRGVSGDVVIETLGTNGTGCANTRYRFTFTNRPGN